MGPARRALAGRLGRLGRASGAAEATRAAFGAEAGQAGHLLAQAAWEGARAGASDDLSPEAAALAARPENRPAALADRRTALDREIAAGRARLASEFPRFFELINPPAVTVADLQGGGDAAPLLEDSEALVLLSPPEGAFPGLVWAVTRERVAWAEIPLSAADLSDAIARLHTMLDGGGRTRAPQTAVAAAAAPPGARGFDRALALELYEALFGAPEIRAVLADRPDWVLAPQGVLLSLPFAALVTGPPEGRDDDPAALRATDWLGLERALAVVPSAATLRSLRRLAKTRAAAPALPFFGLGDPAFEGAPADARRAAGGAVLAEARDYFRDAAGNAASVRGLSRLPGTRIEAEAMALAFGAGPESLLLGTRANETGLAAASDGGALSRARVVLMATHGLMAGSFDGLAEPALAMTPPAEGPRLIDPVPGRGGAGASGAAPDLAGAVQRGARLDDGLLTASEAARLDLDADWVILSACDTAAGAEPDARGLTGLARAFFYAGARSLLVSHWRVRDDVAARLTTDAVARAQADSSLTRARAFRAAMRAILEDRSLDHTGRALAHPAAWAPFQIVGVE